MRRIARGSGSFLLVLFAFPLLAALAAPRALAGPPSPAIPDAPIVKLYTSEDAHQLIIYLTDPSCDGRAPGTQGIDKAAELVAGKFDAAGLQPAGDNSTWFQSFTDPKVSNATLRNVVGIMPGAGDGFVVIGAHYDHLGRDADRALYPGADDNASGVAALCAIAAELALDRSPHRRSILFIAWSGEEEGLLGSRWYVEHPLRPLASTIAMINLDTVGRMEGRHLIVLNAATAAEFPSTLRGVNLAFGLDLAVPEKSPLGSDQLSFIEKGIPAVHLFTGANADYHRPSDTPDKLNYDGIIRVASFTAELARFLADRDHALEFTVPVTPKTAAAAGAPAPSARRVSLGTIPDFTYSGAGLQISGVMPGSPAEKAGLKKGDRLVAIDGEKIDGIEDFSAVLKSHSPGDKVHVTFARDGKEQTVEAILAERK